MSRLARKASWFGSEPQFSNDELSVDALRTSKLRPESEDMSLSFLG
jgi:hypothetical protein